MVLSILCVKALTLEGAWEGIKFLFTPQWDRLTESQVWIGESECPCLALPGNLPGGLTAHTININQILFSDGGTQIFFSYGVGIGALLALGSYNKFNHNCHKDAIVVCCINTFTSFFSAVVIFSILGYMAHSKGVEVADVVESGPGLAFLVYPEVVLTIAPSPLWSFLFFIMLLTLGIDSQFCGVESLMTGLVDNWPETLQPHRKKFTLGMTILMFLLGLPMITRVSSVLINNIKQHSNINIPQGGIFVFQLMDFYAASGMSLLFCVFFQTIAICWVFGAKRFYGCIEEMIGYRVSYYWYICWVALAPAFMLFIFIFYFVKYTPITMDKYEYPPWGEALGFLISLSSMIWVPGYFVYYMLTTPGTWREVLRKGVTPVIVPRTEARTGREVGCEEVEDVEKQLLQTPEKIRPERSSPPTNIILEEEEEQAEEERPLKEEEESLSTTEGILSNNC